MISGENMIYLENSQIKVGVDLDFGGVITYLSAANNNLNQINRHDRGRCCQGSFYGGPDPYDSCTYMDKPWPWNPIGSGDRYGHSSRVLSHSKTSTSIYIKTKPLQWACDNVECECEFEKKIWLDEDAVRVQFTLHNHRSDKNDYGKKDQELPALYTIGKLGTLTCYTGNKPWTNGGLTVWEHPGFNPWTPGKIQCSEKWAAFYDEETQFGLGLYSKNNINFLTGFAGTKNKGGPYDSDTGYIAGLGELDIKADETYTYEFALVLGYIKTIRTWVYEQNNH
ncbi:hypothetical protein M0812_13143 [Anaeramoeba flamelloides]|uniref:Uncharacterized protein n=1 Tax=Anaeramoeba flamelloides TaxID=1746091 RepID=A0AAV7ZLC4_9EUKA|nr:hypothetical protein M0812_13143 [Anaeramoeba flamelloides]